MSIDQLRKQAKNLHRFLPAFVAEHGNTALTLSACQELAARINGYPNWHEAVHRPKAAASPAPGAAIPQAAAEDGAAPVDPAHALYLKVDAMEDAARHRHFQEVGGMFLYSLAHDDERKPVLEFLIGDVNLPLQEASAALHADIEHGYRMSRDPNSTIVLNIQAALIPEFVFDAVRRFQYFGISLVVLHGENCSLDADSKLPARLMALIRDAGGQGQVWHPVLHERVWMHPRL
jgi:hypothetical protein